MVVSVEAALGSLAAAPRCCALSQEQGETRRADGDSGPAGRECLRPAVPAEKHDDGGDDPGRDTDRDDRCWIGQPRTQCIRFRLTVHEM